MGVSSNLANGLCLVAVLFAVAACAYLLRLALSAEQKRLRNRERQRREYWGYE